MEVWPKDRYSLYGAFAYASVILTCFLQFVFVRPETVARQNWQAGPLALTFGLGALYTIIAIFSDGTVARCGQRWTLRLYLLLCAIVTTMIFVSPARGFFGIIVLPLVSQGIFEFRWRGALVSGLFLFGSSVSVFWYHYGAKAIPEAIMSYSAAFAFTSIFTVITKRALEAREREEKLRLDLEAAHAKLQEYAAQVEDLATTRERNRLAREIHDGVGHYLTVVKTQLDAAAALLPVEPDRARESMTKAAKLAGEALDEVRRSVGTLRTDTARPPLPEALRSLVKQSDPPVALVVDGTPRSLRATAEHALFRTAQEGLTNIRKHAAATRASLALDFRDPQRVRLTLTDDGRGTSATAVNGAAAAEPGHGLRGLRERIEVIGGSVHSGNRATGGFELRVEVPA